jgi:hypothetical protein
MKEASFKEKVWPHPIHYFYFIFCNIVFYNKDDLHQKQFEEDLVMLIAKELVPLSLVEAPFFRRLVLRQNPRLSFPSKQKLRHDILLRIAERTKERFVSPTLDSCNTYIVSFDLWMSRGGVDTFVLIVHFLNDKWEFYHVTIGFFEIVDTSRSAMALQVNDVLTKHGLNARVLAYVKDEGSNLSTMTFPLTLVMSCEVLGLLALFVRSYWGHAMSKCC